MPVKVPDDVKALIFDAFVENELLQHVPPETVALIANHFQPIKERRCMHESLRSSFAHQRMCMQYS